MTVEILLLTCRLQVLRLFKVRFIYIKIYVFLHDVSYNTHINMLDNWVKSCCLCEPFFVVLATLQQASTSLLYLTLFFVLDFVMDIVLDFVLDVVLDIVLDFFLDFFITKFFSKKFLSEIFFLTNIFSP